MRNTKFPCVIFVSSSHLLPPSAVGSFVSKLFPHTGTFNLCCYFEVKGIFPLSNERFLAFKCLIFFYVSSINTFHLHAIFLLVCLLSLFSSLSLTPVFYSSLAYFLSPLLLFSIPFSVPMFPLAHLSPSFHARSFVFYLLVPCAVDSPTLLQCSTVLATTNGWTKHSPLVVSDPQELAPVDITVNSNMQ
jgi:hypothetical protein